ncbi:MAG: 6,7-dimethyl-8-ribityllumazine synthase [Ignavibacteria bacterium]|jgi:6,7-dimethyl-8-ribityllumazine synthase|nr:6,7-dimethyl-8-ribityllumazine synthase [Ignavibacteria bacterium]
MITRIEGTYEAIRGNKIAIVASRWNEFIVSKLIEGSLDALRRHNIDDNDLTIAYCPGAFEIPLVTQKLAESGKYNAVIALGAVIRGATPHFDYIAAEVTKGLANVSLKTGIPCVYGVLTTDSIEQAIERAGTKAGNKGFEAAMTAIELISLFEKI